MVTACLIILILLSWYGYKAYVASVHAKLLQAKQRQFELTHWKKEEEQGTASIERVLSYADMQLTSEVRDYSDGGYLGDMWSRQRDSWKKEGESLQGEGWTEKEWEDYWINHLTKYEVRRLNDGTWQGRLIHRYWKARVTRALDRWAFMDDDDFKRLTGLTKDEWKSRGDFYNEEFRPWTTIIADAPAIEAGYQRFIHNA